MSLLVDFIDAPACPSMDRRIHIAKGPLIGWHLPIGMHVPFSRELHKLPLGELWIDQSKRNRVKGAIPCKKTGILPLVWKRKDVIIIQVNPIGISLHTSLRNLSREGILFQPIIDHKMVKLLIPEHPRKSLPLDQAQFFRCLFG